MSERVSERQQIIDLRRTIDRQSAIIGKQRTRLDAASDVIAAVEESIVHQDFSDPHRELERIDVVLRNALEAAKGAGFETA